MGKPATFLKERSGQLLPNSPTCYMGLCFHAAIVVWLRCALSLGDWLESRIAGVADKVSWILQCQAKASSVSDTVQLLLGKGSSVIGSGTSTAEGDSPVVSALTSCLGTADSLNKALTAHKKELFQAWQVCARFSLGSALLLLGGASSRHTEHACLQHCRALTAQCCQGEPDSFCVAAAVAVTDADAMHLLPAG